MRTYNNIYGGAKQSVQGTAHLHTVTVFVPIIPLPRIPPT